MKDLTQRLRLPLNYKEIAEHGPVFTDPNFPTTNATIGPEDEEMKDLIRRKVQWKRVMELCGEYKLFRGIDVDDIVQGELGDCYFLSGVTGISENPNRILKLFRTKKENKYGCYAVTLYICGMRRTIVLDDYFPIVNNMWALTHSREPEMWVMLLEKAWAKAHGNYGMVSGGDSREALSALTGAPTTLLRHSEVEKENLWTVIFNSTKKKYIMSAGGAKDTQGLYSGHAYSLLKAVEINTESKGVVRLIQIRNPWGAYEWNGDWSDHSELWTPELRLKLGHVIAEDGTFYIGFDDYFEFFSYTFVCQCVDIYRHSDLVINQHEACVAFELLSETKGFFSVHQATPRMMNGRGCKPLYVELYAYRDQGLEIVKPCTAKNKDLDFSHNPAGCNALGVATLEVTLPPGLYIMHAFYLNKEKPSVKYLCFTSYASRLVDLIYLRGKTSVKDITRSELRKTIESYVKSRDVILPDMKPAKGTAEACMNNHSLTYSDPTTAFRCDLCREKRFGERYSCNKCKYDVCTDCRGTNKSSTVSTAELRDVTKHDIDECPKGHKLACKKATKIMRTLSFCSACGKVTRFIYDHWMCEPCAYYLCEECKVPTVSKAIELNATTLRCTFNHALKFDYMVYPGNSYACDKCTRQSVCTKGRWRCPECNYDLCSICAPEPAYAKGEACQGISEPVAPSVTTVCDSNHMLWFSTYSYLSGVFECNKCMSQKHCSDGRWLCFQCEYDICSWCRSPPQDATKYTKTCSSGHFMTLSSRRFNSEDEYYRCSYCRKLGRIEDSRWWCPICNYDICLDCIKIDIVKVEEPKTTSIESRRCKDKHQFVKSKEKTNFICEEENEKVENQSTYKCKKCGMVQCGKCAPKTGTMAKEDPKNKEGKEGNENKSILSSAGDVVKIVAEVVSVCVSALSSADVSIELCGQSCNIL